MAKIGVRWLEPERDVGKTTFVNVRDLICDRSQDIAAGTTVKARWRSSGRIYKATLLSNLKAKSSKRPKPAHSIEVPSQVVTETDENSNSCSDSDDDVPLAVHTSEECTLPLQFPKTIQPGKSVADDRTLEELKEQVRDLQVKVNSLSDDMRTLKESCARETATLKNTFKEEMRAMKENFAAEMASFKDSMVQGQRDMAGQLQSVLSAISDHQSITQITHDIITGRINARKEAKENDRTLLTNNGKRLQPAFGRQEDGNVVAYNENGARLITINTGIYRKTFDDSKTGTSFLRKLLRHCFTDEELAESNFSGGTVTSVSGLTVKKCLDRARVFAILAQVELEFPQSTKGKNFYKMREAVNEECRRFSRQIRLGLE